MKDIPFEEFEIGVSRCSGGRTVTETDIVLHAGQSGDFYPHHMDAEWCNDQPFKKRIAHGTLVFTIGVGQTAGEINPLAMTYGYEKLRFPNPVFIGDTIRTRASIAGKRDHKRPEYGIVVEKLETLNQRGECVMACEHLLLVRKGRG